MQSAEISLALDAIIFTLWQHKVICRVHVKRFEQFKEVILPLAARIIYILL